MSTSPIEGVVLLDGRNRFAFGIKNGSFWLAEPSSFFTLVAPRTRGQSRRRSARVIAVSPIGFGPRFIPRSPAVRRAGNTSRDPYNRIGERTKVQVFAMRSMASGAAFHRAYLHATQQAFLEAHEHAFAYFGGVFQLLRPDYVPGHVIGLMCPGRLCGQRPRSPWTYWST